MNRLLEAKPPRMDLGLPEEARKRIADELGRVLADTYTLYLKTHYYHWNVTGPLLATLHEMFEAQYQELWQSVDDIAERIRSLGAKAPGTYGAFRDLSSIGDDTDVPDADQMVSNLIAGHEAVIRTIRPVLDEADRANDQATADLLTQRLHAHEKTAWMLRSMLE